MLQANCAYGGTLSTSFNVNSWKRNGASVKSISKEIKVRLVSDDFSNLLIILTVEVTFENTLNQRFGGRTLSET